MHSISSPPPNKEMKEIPYMVINDNSYHLSVVTKHFNR